MRVLTGRRGVLMLAGAMALVGGLLFVPLAHAPAVLPLPLVAWALLPAFLFTEVFVVHLQFRREAQTISLSEIPLVLGLMFVAPATLLAARLGGSLVALALHRRQPPLKMLFNLSYFLLEVVLAVTVYRAVLRQGSVLGPTGWEAAFVATAVASLVGALAVPAAICLHQRAFQLRLVPPAVLATLTTSMVNTSLTLVGVMVLRHDLRAAVLLAIVGGLLFVGYRAYTSLRAKHETLELLQHFTEVVEQARASSAVVQTLLGKMGEVLRADVVEITFCSPTGTGPWESARWEGASGTMTTERRARPTSLQQRVLATRRALLFDRKAVANAPGVLLGTSLRDILVAPLCGEGGVFGFLLVGNRLGDVSTFDRDDLRLFEMLAHHASVALENDRLIDALRREATHDALTGLANRVLLHERLREAATQPLAVLLLDLDRFKEINDTLGHHVGDRLLQEVACRLEANVPAGATVARLGGDEFAILLPGAGSTAAMATADDVRDLLEQPFELDGFRHYIGASIGIALAPVHGTEGNTLIQRADVAMYAAKEQRGGVQLYDAERDQHTVRRLTLGGALRAALDGDGGLTVHYQPKVELRTGTVIGFEALLRWQHPVLGTITPDEFIPVAEHTALIRPLTMFVIEAALGQSAAWRQAGVPCDIAVNLSVGSLTDPLLPADIAALLAGSQTPPGALTLEITESSLLVDTPRALEVLDRLGAMGIRLAIDDFGTGYSSLSQLKRLPVDEIKIDKSFVLNMTSDDNDAVIVRSTVDLGHNLALQVVAEGVEDEPTRAHLVRLGCDVAQGFYVSRPLVAAAVEAWVRAWDGEQAATRQLLAVPA